MNESDYNLRTDQLRNAGSQLASTTGVLQTIYFAAISFSNLKTKITGIHLWLFFVPVVCWFVSLLLSIWVLFPDGPIRKYADADEQRGIWFAERRKKWKIAYFSLFGGILWMSVVIFLYFFIL